jgi:molybdopterin synthase sulfurtransferase
MVNSKKFNAISTQELYEKIENPDYKIIDIRSVDAYNGWRLKDEKRGGHIKGAKNLPYKWSKYIDWIEIVRKKDIKADHYLILYGYDSLNVQHVADQFFKAGYQHIQLYRDFVSEWTVNEKYPMDKLKRYKHLVSAEWVNKLIKTGNAAEYINNKFVIIHAHYQNRKAYEQGHIPKSIDLDTNLLESSKTWNIRSAEELAETLKHCGITYDTTVVLYGRFSNPDNNNAFPGSSAGQLGAMRCALIMMYAGVDDVRILNGGLQSWVDSGFKTTTKEYRKKPVKDFGVNIPVRATLVKNLKEAKEILQHPEKNLVSVRSWREYIGEVSGYHYIKKKGRIPGAVFGNCGSDAYHMENYRNLDHTTREYHEIKDLWKKAGITADNHNSFYCGTGWRGSEALINAWLMGWDNISVYDGGWFEWSNHDNPYETGIPTTTEKSIQVEG